MAKSTKILLGCIVFLFVVLMYIESNGPRPLDLRPYYTQDSKKPLGSFVFYNLLQHSTKKRNIEKINETLFTFNKKDAIGAGSLLFINNLIELDQQSFEVLTKYIKDGNDVLISANYLPQIIIDSLEVKVEYILKYDAINYKSQVLLEKSAKQMKSPLNWDLIYFSEFKDTYEVLGYSKATHETKDEEAELKANFLRIPIENGNLYLHTFPEAFSNLFLLHEENYSYTEDLLNLLDLNHTIYLDEHNKTGKERLQSLLYYITSEPALNAAYKTFLILCLLLIIFEGKRKQRSIPVVTPLANKTYEFAQTVSLMYLDQKEFKILAEKQIFQWMDYVRNHLKIETKEVNSNFYAELSTKLGKKEEEVRKIFEFIQQLEQKKRLTKEEIYELHQQIEFLKQ